MTAPVYPVQNLRFYGRTTAGLKASTSVVREQMAATDRLFSAADGFEDEEEPRRNGIVRAHRQAFATGRGWMLSSPRLSALPPLGAQSAR